MAVCPSPSIPPLNSIAPPVPARLPTRWCAAIVVRSSAAYAVRRSSGSTTWASAESLPVQDLIVRRHLE